jgi:hypothetical protein
METVVPKHSSQLGRITAAQFQAALDHFHLGQFVRAERARFGNVSQVLFLTSSSGEYVLRGAPHEPAQLAEQRFFLELLHGCTAVPVAWPYLLDEGTEIFGWSYVIMPRLRGVQLEDPDVLANLASEDRRDIAWALGDTLAAMQALTWPFAGAYDRASGTVQPFAEGYADWVLVGVRRVLDQARVLTPRLVTDEDVAWVGDLIELGRAALQVPFVPCFTMWDYQEHNVVAEQMASGWRISGVFDVDGYFGDGEAALSRQIAMFLERDPMLAGEFAQAYFAARPPRPGFAARFPLYMLDERLAIWEWAQRERLVWWNPELSLRRWLEPFTAWAAVLGVQAHRTASRRMS